MIKIKPFAALRPEAPLAKEVASKPYDVLSVKEAKDEAQGNPNSFLHITRSEIDMPESIDVHSQEVYEKAKENLDAFISRGILFSENKPCYYIYRLSMNGKSQTGITCGSSIEDYNSGLIKKHEHTRPEKELDRINHMKALGAQTGNVFMAYKNVAEIDAFVAEKVNEKSPQYDFTAADGVQHSVWVVNDDESVEKLTSLFAKHVPATYIADGHHRAASAAKVFEQTKDRGYNNAEFFLTTLFPANDLRILDYNRIIKDLNGNDADAFLHSLKENFTIEKQSEAYSPAALHTFGLYLQKQWYSLEAKKSLIKTDPIGLLDISILQESILSPLLNIHDQRTDKRIDFVGGIRGLKELEKRVDSGDWAMAISLHPVSIQQLFDVADSGDVMPPKSTWFEPKLRDGLLTFMLNQ